jgi:hypothetical protein
LATNLHQDITMTFVFQQPGSPKLLEAIDAAAANASSGGGVFAFASKGGVDALFACPNISSMLARRQPFHLIVGVDAITNAEALLCLSDKLGKFRTLTVNVFFHENPGSTFHPKFSWFREGRNLRLVTGSGNLTLRGVGQATAHNPTSSNWEAFSVQSFVDAQATDVNQQIDGWRDAQRIAGTLCELDDARVRDRAMANGRVRYTNAPARVRRAPAPGALTAIVHTTLVDGVELGPEVLVREIPLNRTGQADVGKRALTEFFGYEGKAKNVFIQHVSLDDELGPVEPIRLFVNQSRNYRLELRAIAELEYDIGDDDRRMILVATKLDHRSFRYTILPVTSDSYSAVSALLGPVPARRGKSRPMREDRISPDMLRNAWPNVPNNLLPVDVLTPEP